MPVVDFDNMVSFHLVDETHKKQVHWNFVFEEAALLLFAFQIHYTTQQYVKTNVSLNEDDIFFLLNKYSHINECEVNKNQEVTV